MSQDCEAQCDPSQGDPAPAGAAPMDPALTDPVAGGTPDAGETLDLDASLGYLLKQAASTLRLAMEATLRPLGMTITQYACLELLAQRPGLSNSELARGTFVTRQSMNTLLQAMERDALVTRPSHPPVGRALPVELTARGREKLAIASGAVNAVEQRMRSGLDTHQQDELRHLLVSRISALSSLSAAVRRPPMASDR